MSNFNKEYIEHCERKIQDILNDEREYSDWTQICFSMKDAIHAAIEVWGISNEDEIHKMGCFIREMVFKEILNTDMEYREILEKSLSAIQYLRIHGFSTYMESEGIVNRIMMFKDKNEMRNRKIKSIL